jgi:PiT family inorganic phosphate transporter
MLSEVGVADHAPAETPSAAPSVGPRLDHKPNRAATTAFFLILAGGLAFAAYSVITDVNRAGEPLAIGVFALLGLALLIALGFEFVNGFHDTANAVATVIYTNSMPPMFAVVWSGVFNFLGVMVSTGAVAFGIVTLLPVELILQMGSSAGYAMIFALLLSAIIWNLGTWALGIPNSSSHALIGSIIGVGLANQLMSPAGQATSGVDWAQAGKIIQTLLISPVIGFTCALLLLLAMKLFIRNKTLYQAPVGDKPPPPLIRGLLILTCTGVSFAHGGNDGQKGMGLIMLILIGAAPTAYALNRTMPDSHMPAFIQSADAGAAVFAVRAGSEPAMDSVAARDRLGLALREHKVDQPQVYRALSVVATDIENQVKTFGAISHVPPAKVPNMRNDMYMVSDAINLLTKSGAKFSEAEAGSLKTFKKELESGTRFIPDWVKIVVALALGLGTMVGWKRIVVTVGERIGKTHLTYAQGASAELVAAGMIGAAEVYGLPVSTTHILSSGVAGTMAGNGSGLRWSTLRNIASAWVLTLPAAIALAGGIYFLLRQVV